MDPLLSQLALSQAGYLAAIGLLGLVLGWWLGRGGTQRSAKEAADKLELSLATAQEEHEETSLEVGRLADQVASTNIELEEARERASTALANLSEAEDQLVTERQRVASFEPLLTKRDNKLEELRAEQVAYHDRLTTLEDDKRQAQNRIEAMASELSAAQVRAAELETALASSRQRAEQLEDRVAENAGFGAEVERLRQVEEDLRLWKERSTGRDEERDQARRQLEETAQERDSVVAELATLSRQLEQAEIERKTHDLAAEAARRELEAQRQRVKRRDDQVAALERAGAGRSELEIEIESLRGELSASVRRVTDLQQRLATAEAARTTAEAERFRMERELETLLTAPLIDVDRMATAKPVTFESADLEGSQAAPAPELLEVPRGAADDLQRIRGIGAVLAETLNSLGIYHFGQIADWSESDLQWVAAHIDTFPDRIVRDEWREQAVQLEREKQRRQV